MVSLAPLTLADVNDRAIHNTRPPVSMKTFIYELDNLTPADMQHSLSLTS